ncbi:hypothetical protein PG990_002327 [Apiospora arundinis]
MNPSKSDVGLNGPSAEDSHRALEMRPFDHRPLASEDRAPGSTFFEDALPWFDDPFDRFQAPLSTALSSLTPFPIVPPLPLHTPTDAQVDFEMSVTPTNSSATGQEGIDGSPQASSPPYLEHPRVKRICDGIPEEEASTMESILRGDYIAFPAENSSRNHLRPLAPIPTQVPSAPTAEKTTNAALNPVANQVVPSGLTMAKLPSQPLRAPGTGAYEKLNVKAACDRCKFKKLKCDEGKPCIKCKSLRSSRSQKYEQAVLLANRCGHDFGKTDFLCLSDCFRAMCNLYTLHKVMVPGLKEMSEEPELINRGLFDRLINEAMKSISLVSELRDDSNLSWLLLYQASDSFYYPSKGHNSPHLPTLLQVIGKGLEPNPIRWRPAHFFADLVHCPTNKSILGELSDAPGESPVIPVGIPRPLLLSGLRAFLTAQLPMLLRYSRSYEEDDIFKIWNSHHLSLWDESRALIRCNYPVGAIYLPVAGLASLYLICLMLKQRWLCTASAFWKFYDELFKKAPKSPTFSSDIQTRIKQQWLICKEILADGDSIFGFPLESDPDLTKKREIPNISTRAEALTKKYLHLIPNIFRAGICTECRQFRPLLLSIHLMEFVRWEHREESLAKPKEKRKRKRMDAAEPAKLEDNPTPERDTCWHCKKPI